MYTAVSSNKRKTVLLMALFVAFIATLGYVVGVISDSPGLLYFFGIGALVYSIVTYFLSAKIALGMSGAREIKKSQAPELYRLVENLSITAGLPMPKVYIIEDSSPNAFATGRDPKHAAVAVTSGLLERLEKDELQGVLAHEMAHVGNYDIRLMSVVTALVSIVSIISDLLFRVSLFNGDDDSPNPLMLAVGIVLAILAPLIALVIQLAISRRREYLADATAVQLTRYPDGLAKALEKISHGEPMHRTSSATAHLYIANPLGGGKGIGGAVAGLFSTHPPIEDRVARLRQMGDVV
ncbi:protease [Patescibacteria group bacterium]|nr:MAG: protease [Patescibacteria group bacterium]